MRTTGTVFAILTTIALGACSKDQDPSGAANTNLPPAPPVTPTPQPPIPVPAVPVPTYLAHLPPLATPPAAPIACSPCKKIAFQSWTDSDLYSVNADGTENTLLAKLGSFDAYPAWSPDGSRVAFSTTSGNGSFELLVVNADGSNVVHIFDTEAQWMGDPAWSPDGTRIAYATTNPITRTGSIMLIEANGGTPMPIYSVIGSLRSPTWSPDGARLAIEREWAPLGDSDIFLINADGSGLAPLTDGNSTDGIGYQSPSWSPDGTKIAMNIQYRVDVNVRLNVVGTISVDGTGLTPIIVGIENWSPSSRPAWSPDGTMIAFDSGSYEGQVDVSWVRADGSARGTIVTNGRSPDWQR